MPVPLLRHFGVNLITKDVLGENEDLLNLETLTDFAPAMLVTVIMGQTGTVILLP